MEEIPRGNISLDRVVSRRGTLKLKNINYILHDFDCELNLIGDRRISSEIVGILKYEAPILAEKKKKIDTERTDKKNTNQVMGSNILDRFQILEAFEGYLGKVSMKIIRK